MQCNNMAAYSSERMQFDRLLRIVRMLSALEGKLFLVFIIFELCSLDGRCILEVVFVQGCLARFVWRRLSR